MIGLLGILVLSFLLGLDYKRVNKTNKNKAIYLAVVFGSMLLFAVLRGYSVGIDYENRVEHMEHIFRRDFLSMLQFTQDTTEFQFLYTVPIWLVSRVFPCPWFFNAVMDCFVLITFAWFFYRYAKDVTFATIMFVVFAFAASLNITRQYVAAAFFLWAIHQLLQKKPWRAFLLLLAASLMHISAIVLFAVYLFYFIGFKNTKTRLAIYLVAAVLLYALFDEIILVFLKVFPRYSYALRDKFVSGSGFSVKWLLLYLSIYAGLWFVTPYDSIIQQCSDERRKNLELTGGIGLGFVLYAALAVLKAKMWFVHRMQVYFMFGFCMIIPEVVYYLSDSVCYYPGIKPIAAFLEGEMFQKKIVPAVLTVLKLALVVWGVIQFVKDPHELLPYRFIWE